MSSPQEIDRDAPQNWPAARSFFIDIAGDVRRLWRELAVAHLLATVTTAVVLTPLATALLGWCVRFSGVPALTDVEILYFTFLNPIGLVGMVLAGGIALAIAVMDHATLLTIGYASSQGRVLRWHEAFMHTMRRSLSLLRLTTLVVVRTLFGVAPLLGAGGIVYFFLLTGHDINYYLVEKPRAFWIAAGLISLALMMVMIVILRLITGWILSMPVLLFERSTPLQALEASWSVTAGRRRFVFVWLLGWYLTTSGSVAVAHGILVLLGRWTVPHVTGSLNLLALVLGGLMLASTLVNVLITFASASVLSLFVARLYRTVARHAEPEVVEQQLQVSATTSRRRMPSGPRLILGLAAALAVAAMLGVVNLHGLRADRPTQIIAHRGASALAPENTLAAFEQAIADGADWVELDVQETSDGEVVVIHDRDLKKMGNVNVNIWQATKEQLDGIDIGSRFGPQFRGQHVPTLGEVLDLCKGRVGVNIELKYYGHQVRLEERVVEIVESRGMAQQVVVMSLDYAGVRKIRALRPDWKVGLLKSISIGDVTQMDVDFFAVNSRTATPATIGAAHRSGKQVFVWTVNDPASASLMISRGVDGIITDRPAMVAAVLQERAGYNAAELLLLELGQLFGSRIRYVPR